MSKTINQLIACNECGFNQNFNLYVSINVIQSPELKQNVLNNNFNIFTCSKCGFMARVESPLLYYDTEKKFMICLFDEEKSPYDILDGFIPPLQNIVENPYQLRTVFSYNQLFEKILIFDEGLDDRKIEYFKNVIRVVECEENEITDAELFFNGCYVNDDDEKGIAIAKIVGEEVQSISLPWNYYMGIIKKLPAESKDIDSEFNKWINVDAFYWLEGDSLMRDEWYVVKGGSSGSNYLGLFNSGDKNIHGVYIYPYGEIYIGQCKNGIPHGFGILSFPEGGKYIGEIRDNMYNGQGTLYFCDVSNYTGEFKDDKFHGQGILTVPNGSKIAGLWEDDILINEQFETDTYIHLTSGIEFPEKLAGFDRVAVTNYEITEPGIGISVTYNTFQFQIWATIYVYNYGVTDIPDGVGSDLVKTSFNKAVDDIFKAYENGMYDGVVKISEGKTALSNSLGSLDTLSVFLMYSSRGTENHSHVYLTGYNNHVFKIRFSYSSDIESEGKRALKLFLCEAEKLLINKMDAK